MGTWVSACPAKATSPIRSEDRARTNSVAVRRATSSRLAGEKSSASMLLEISTANTIEIPSLRSSARADPRRGPAAATIHAARQTDRSEAGRRAIHNRSTGPSAGRTSLIGAPASFASRWRRHHHHSGSAASSNSSRGRAKLMPTIRSRRIRARGRGRARRVARLPRRAPSQTRPDRAHGAAHAGRAAARSAEPVRPPPETPPC